MSKVAAALVFLLEVCSVCFASSAPIEVLYVETHSLPPERLDLLYTYNVNPQTAVAEQVGSPLPVATTSIDPLTVNGKHVLYLWNGTDVWKYNTNAQGAPEPRASQHLNFGFPYPVWHFLADPNGKFAYATTTWTDNQDNVYSVIRLFTIDQTTGELVDTRKNVATYGPNPYIFFRDYIFGASGRVMFAQWQESAPFTSGLGYDYYGVDQTTGRLSSLKAVPNSETFNCTESCGVGITDLIVATTSSCCGSPLGIVQVSNNVTGQTITCQASMLSVCGGGGDPYIDPSGQNVVLPAYQTFQVTHIDFANSQLTAAASIPYSNSGIVFSPDNRLVYSYDRGMFSLNVYAFDASTGEVGAQSSITEISQPESVTIAATTF